MSRYTFVSNMDVDDDLPDKYSSPLSKLVLQVSRKCELVAVVVLSVLVIILSVVLLKQPHRLGCNQQWSISCELNSRVSMSPAECVQRLLYLY